MDFKSVLEELYRKRRLKNKWDLKNIRRVLELSGNPQEKFRSINVCGTNGKGSVTAFTAAILEQAGYRVGRYHSPHVTDFRERIQVNGMKIPAKEVARVYSEMLPAFRKVKGLSFFEIVTAIALKYFAEMKVDFAVLEAGMGGRLDATSACNQEACVITSVSLDHTARLGKTKRLIAREKAGLVHENSLVVTSEKGEALEEISKACREKNSELVIVKEKPEFVECTPSGVSFNFKGMRFKTRLAGAFQAENAALAIEACSALGVSLEDACKGVKQAWVPGRMEVVGRNPLVVVDCAHNPGALKALSGSLSCFRHEKMILVFAAMKDKDVEGMLKEIAPKASAVILTKPALSRAASLKKLSSVARRHSESVFVFAHPIKALGKALSLASQRDLVLVTGSAYLVGEIGGSAFSVGQ